MSPQDPVPGFPKNYEEAIIFLQAVANMREDVPLPTDTNNLHGLWRAMFWRLNDVLGRTGASRLDVKHWGYLKESVHGAEELFRWASDSLKADATFRGLDSKARPHVATFLRLVDPHTAPEFEEHRRRVEELYAPCTPQTASNEPSSSSGSLPSSTATNAIGPSSHPHSIYSGVVFSNPDSNASLTPSGSATNGVMNISAHSRKPSASRLSTPGGTIPESYSTPMTSMGSQISHVSSVSRPPEGKGKNPSARMGIGEQQLYFDTPLLTEPVTDSQPKAEQKPPAKGGGKRKRDAGESPTKAVAPRKRPKTTKAQGPVPAQLPPTPQLNRATATPLGRGIPQVLDASQYLDPLQFANTPPSLDSAGSASRYHMTPPAMDHLRTLSRSQPLASPCLSESHSYGLRVAPPYTASNVDSPVTVQQANALFNAFNSAIYGFEVHGNPVASASTPGRSSVDTNPPDIQSSALFSQAPPFTLGIEPLPWQPSLANPSTSTAIPQVSYLAGGPGSSAGVGTASGIDGGGTVKEPSFIDDVNYLAGFLYHSRYGGEHASSEVIATMHTMVREKIFLADPALWAEWKAWMLRGRELVAKSPHIYVETKPGR